MMEQNSFSNIENQRNQRKYLILFIGLLVIMLIAIIIAMIYFNFHPLNINQTSQNNLTNPAPISTPKLSNQEIIMNMSHQPATKHHTPVTLGPDDILVSFRIDDITFAKSQKPILENALYLARKYNITFDLAVVAQLFDQRADSETFKIYQDNQDVFEIVAHGLTHLNPINGSDKGEFFDITYNKPIPSEIQEEHIKNMSKIFKNHNLSNFGNKIFFLPWDAGDENTIKIANRYGYRLITQTYVPNKSLEYKEGNIIVSQNWIGVKMNRTIDSIDIQSYKDRLNDLIKKNQTRIEIMTHPINFNKIEGSEDFIRELVNNNLYKSKIKFSMVSDRLNEIK